MKKAIIEYAQCDHPRVWAIKMVNVLRALEKSGVTIPVGPLDGLEIENAVSEIEKRGITIPSVPFNELSKVESRNLVESVRNIGIGIGLMTMMKTVRVPPAEKKLTDDMTPAQRIEYEKFQDLKLKARQDKIIKEFQTLKNKK